MEPGWDPHFYNFSPEDTALSVKHEIIRTQAESNILMAWRVLTWWGLRLSVQLEIMGENSGKMITTGVGGKPPKIYIQHIVKSLADPWTVHAQRDYRGQQKATAVSQKESDTCSSRYPAQKRKNLEFETCQYPCRLGRETWYIERWPSSIDNIILLWLLFLFQKTDQW